MTDKKQIVVAVSGGFDPIHPGHIRMFKEAKALGAKVDLVIYPGQSHGFGADWTKKDATDAFNRTVAFLKKELAVK